MTRKWPQYGNKEQHDAAEFGMHVREAIQSEGATGGAGRTVAIAECVGCTCGYEGEPGIAVSDGMEVARSERLQDAMAETVTELEYQCATCAKTTVWRKRRWVVSAGDALEVRVGRFGQGAGGEPVKDGGFMEYPSEGLEVAGVRYGLRGVAVHHGTNMVNGHYTAYVKWDEQWYLTNDEDVDQVEEETVLQQEAYILWYCREAAGDEAETEEETINEWTEEVSAEQSSEEAMAETSNRRRQVRATEIERVRRAGPSWRAVIGVDEQASGEAARKKMRESMWCLCAEEEPATEQERGQAKSAAGRLVRARKEMVSEERVARGGGRGRWGVTEEERGRQATRRHVACTPHQCPPTNIRQLPVGTKVEVRGSAEGRRRISVTRPGGDGAAWRGVVVQQQNMCGEYVVEGRETRGWTDRFDPCVVPESSARVPWPLLTVVGGPVEGEEGEGDAEGWREYVRLWKAECTRHYGEAEGRSFDWMDARTRMQVAERKRPGGGTAARAKAADKGKKRGAETRAEEPMRSEERRGRGERDWAAVLKERGARFKQEHARLKETPGPRGAKARRAHSEDATTANTGDALSKFLERRKDDVDPKARAAAEAAAKEGANRRSAKSGKREAAAATVLQASRGAPTAQGGAGASSSGADVAAGSKTAREAATATTAKRQREEDSQAGQERAAKAKPHSGAGQTGAATDGDGGGGGAARAAAGAETAAKKKKKRHPESRERHNAARHANMGGRTNRNEPQATPGQTRRDDKRTC